MALSLLGMITYQCTVLIISKFLDNEVDIFEVLETRMCRAGWASRWPLIMTNNIAKQNTSLESRQIQLGFLAEKESILSRLCELQQQEIYLGEHLEGESIVEENPPQYQRIPERRHSINSQEKLQQIVSEARDLWIRSVDQGGYEEDETGTTSQR
ncbi:hypothetical protein N7528_002539 [Penicillium herquei]|nr:hypothetical protein N7528_002539 [Penicillium herquei]